MDDVLIAAGSTRSEANREAAREWIAEDAPIVSDWHELLARSDLDGVVVSTPGETHPDIVAAALAAGLPVLCEKPLAVTLADCDRLLEAERASDGFVQLGLEFRHAPVMQQAKAWIEEGRLGQPAQVWCHIFRDKRESPRKRPDRWVANGGVFVEFLCHYFDLLNWMSGGAPFRVSGIAGRKLGTEAWDHGWINIEYDNGTLGHLGYSLLCPRDAERLELRVAGDRGALDIDLNGCRLSLSSFDEERIEWEAPPVDHPNSPYPGSFEQIRHFVECVRTGQPSPVNAAAGRQMLSLGYAAERTVAERAPVGLE